MPRFARPSFPAPFVFLVVLALALSACGGCSDDTVPLGGSPDGGEGLPPPSEGGPWVDPCAAPPIDGTAGVAFAEAVRFLTEGACPRQTGVDKAYLDATRVSVVRGRVLDEAGKAISGAKVRAPGEPKLGETKTDSEGRFDFVVLGGATTRLRFQTEGKLVAHRSASPRANRFVALDDVTLVAPSAKATPLTFGASAWQVASGETSRDESDPRTAIVLVPPGTRAEVTKPNGDKAPLERATLRITEYTRGRSGPSAMPGELPPASAYTYASAFAFDEAGLDTRVTFSAPVITYVDNFLRMKVGAPVPAGVLEDGDAGWKAEASGRVVTVLPGPALDADGDGQADGAEALAAAGITSGELAELAKAGISSGKSYLRVPMAHFSAWDLNWAFGPPLDSIFPPDGDGKGGPGIPCFGSGGSWFECERRTLAEDLPLVGTGVYLHYHSDRMPGRKDARTVTVPVTGAVVPPSAKRAEVSVTVLGVTETKTYAPLTPNLTHTFTWNGKDAYGRDWPGQTVAEVRVGLVYDGVYQNVRTFGAYGDGEAVTGDKTRQEVGLRRGYEVPVGARDQTALGLGGWSLSEHHVYDPAGRVLYRGDGVTRYATDLGATLRIVAGSGRFGGAGDGGQATQAELASPDGVAVDAKGTIYVSESLGHRVRKIENGVISTFAGTGTQGHTGDGGPATQANIDTPRSVTVLRDGRVCFAEQYSDFVRCVGRDGTVRTIAGGGAKPVTADPVPATEATVSRPTALAEGPDGSLYVTMEATSSVARIDPSGRIELAVGGGSEAGESVPARRASLLVPRGLAVGPDGALFIAEQGRNRVRRVDPSGLVTTLAGSGDAGSAGDGGPAASATFRGPTALAVDPDGVVYVSDQGNLRIRRIDRGRVQAYAGGGDRPSLEGSGGRLLALSTRTLALASDGTLVATEESQNRVVTLKSPFPGTTSGETLLPDESGSQVYVFDARGRHIRTLDALTTTPILTFSYDAEGRLVKLEDRHQNVLAISRDGAGRATRIVAPFGQVTTLGYDAQGLLATVTDGLGRKEQLEYAPGGLLTKRVDMGGGVHTMSYDGDGKLVTDADAESRRFSFAQNTVPEGTKVDVTTGLSRRESHVFRAGAGIDEVRSLFDRDGTRFDWTTKKTGETRAKLADGTEVEVVPEADPRLGMLAPYAARHVVRFPSGLTRTVESTWTANVDGAGAIVTLSGERRTADGVTRMVYDGPSRTWTTTSPAGRTFTATVDIEGRLVRSQLPGFPATDRVYDARSRLASATTGARRTTLGYGPAGALASVEDSLGRRVGIERDGALRAIGLVHTDGAKSAYAWSAMDDLTQVTPPGKGAHALTYGKDGQLATYVAPGASPIAVGYDGDRDLTKVTYEDGTATDIVRDGAGRPSRLVYAGGEVSFAYDGATGQLRTLTTSGGQGLAFGWDGALLRDVTASGVAPGVVSSTYDTMLRRATESASGNVVSFGYDADGLLVRAGSIFLTREPASGRLASLSVGLAGETFGYTAYGELASYQARSASGVLLDMALAYDALGRLEEKRENGVTYGYAYDARGRLSRVTRNGTTTHAYTYDGNGNRTDSGITTDGRDRVVAKTGASYTYTGKGERATKTEGASLTRYGYDGRGHLASVELPSGIRVEYELDAYGRRVAKRRSGTVENRYLYRNALQPAAEVDASGNVVTRYVYARGELGPDLMERGGATYALLKDERGSVRFVVDVFSGVVAQALEYDPFGKVTSDTSPGFQPFGFVGGMHDADTGLLHLGAREYDPETGAFTRRDPSGLEGGENQYAYAGGDPVNYWDPDGNFVAAVVVGAAAGAAIGGAEGAVFGAADEVLDQAFDPGRTGFDCGAIRSAAGRGAAAGAAAGAVAGGVGAAAKTWTPGSRPSKNFTPAMKRQKWGAESSGGRTPTCKLCGTDLQPSARDRPGVTPPPNAAQYDHRIARSKGGSGTPENMDLTCRVCNRAKGAE